MCGCMVGVWGRSVDVVVVGGWRGRSAGVVVLEAGMYSGVAKGEAPLVDRGSLASSLALAVLTISGFEM